MPDKHVTLPITGMSCANCAVTIEKALKKKVPGIVNASVNFAAERAFVEYSPSIANIDHIINAIEEAGFGVIRPDLMLEAEGMDQGNGGVPYGVPPVASLCRAR